MGWQILALQRDTAIVWLCPFNVSVNKMFNNYCDDAECDVTKKLCRSRRVFNSFSITGRIDVNRPIIEEKKIIKIWSVLVG